jgi:predicted secreted protein
MKRNVVLQVSARLAASLLALFALLAPAMAGDKALINFIGYSADGKYFAFEEYGIADGIGGAYSEVFIVDLPADKWVYGSPFSVDTFQDPDPEAKPLAEVRAEAMAKAQEKLKPLNITQAVEVLALLGEGVAGDDGKAMSWSTPMCCGPGQVQDDSYELDVETFPIKSTEDYCNDMSPVGYALSFKAGTDTIELHRDGDTLPKSRRCTLDYRLYAVVAPYDVGGTRVAIISSYPYGFEGPDRRFLAVPIDQ